MVFPFPNYLDHRNLNQFQHQEHHHHQSVYGGANHHLQNLLPPPPPLAAGRAGGGAGSIRPLSMADEARIANIPSPKVAAECPRCFSTNTKFCYYNNYNIFQPRHFCKGCKRQWTIGGRIRNVPEGGGRRRNKRSKSSGAARSSSIRGGATNMGGYDFQYSVTESGFQTVNGIGDVRFNVGSNNLSVVTDGSAEPSVWMLPSFQGGFDPPNPSIDLLQYQIEGVEDHHQLPPIVVGGSSNNATSVKMENHQNGNQELNLSSQFMDSLTAPQQIWAENAWTIPSYSSSTHLL